MYVILLFALRLPLKRDKIHMVSQMAHAKNLGKLFMAHPENLYNILCQLIHAFITVLLVLTTVILFCMACLTLFYLISSVFKTQLHGF